MEMNDDKTTENKEWKLSLQALHLIYAPSNISDARKSRR